MAARARGKDSLSATGGRSHRPQRSCVGCGRRDDKDELVRLAVADLRSQDSHEESGSDAKLAVIDHDGRMGGRGAYLCREADGELPNAECLARALRRGSVGRTLRASVAVDPKLVESVSR